MLWPYITEFPPSPPSRSTDWDTSTELEDVPQLLGEYGTQTFEKHSLVLGNEEILKKISDISSKVHQVPLAESLKPEYRVDIQAVREHLKRSLAVAAAAEHRLNKMYRSQLLPLGQNSLETDDVETVINTLYNSRSKLSQYLDTRYVPSEMREKAIIRCTSPRGWQLRFPSSNFFKSSRDRRRSEDESRSPSSDSNADPAALEPEEPEERKPSATQQEKNTKLSSKSTKRIPKELAEITLDLPPNCGAGPKGDNIYEWRSTIFGPPGSVFEGGVFYLDVTFSSDYPFKPPKVIFRTRIYHCNINNQGVTPKDNWSPPLTISKVLPLLTDCNPVDPLVGSRTTQHLTSGARCDRIARQWTKRHDIMHIIGVQGEGAEASHCAANLYLLYNTAFCVCYTDSTLCFYPLETGRLPRKVKAIKSRTL
ncbi:LOW QUALITY PROTEIN: sperm equatorial segment protein 1 [Glossophaga mutica]